ncbi:MAG: carboxymuconolactone decarboxylase family protein [Chloroflexi bacterium]|nr:carboxymuconolactone decarboxylase family protein [Chloroflexota bacterium]
MAEHPLMTVEDLDPELFKLMEASRQLVLSDGALPRKFKLLVALALDASHGATGGVTSLAKAAIQTGATKEEIAETLRVAQWISGVSSTYTAARALQGLF